MNFLNTFIISICATCILTGALYTLTPNGEISNTIKYLFALIFLVSIIAAAKITIKNVDIDFAAQTATNKSSEEMQIAAAEYIYSYALEKNSINFSKITVCTDKLEDGSIEISKVIIYSNCEKEKILKALGGNAQKSEVEIINE